MHLSRRNIISVDVESNGLYGQPFCVGAVEMDWGGRVLKEFLGRCPLDEVEDEWVLKHVIPKLNDVEQTHDSLEAMEGDFVTWLITKMADSPNVIVLVDAGFPVDYRFLYTAIQGASSKSGKKWIRERYSPYPLLDLASVLAGAGLDPDESRLNLAVKLRTGLPPGELHNERLHHPVWDAETSALALVSVIRMMEDRNGAVHE